MVTNHFLVALYYVSSSAILLGSSVGALIIDVILFVIIGLQIFIIVALIEDKEGEKKRRAT